MFKNYLVSAWRNIKAQKFVSVIGILGLSAGLACCLFLFLYLNDEWSFDRFHEKGDRIVRVGFEGEFGRTARTPHILGPTLLRSFPEVENAVRIKALERPVVRRGEEKFFEDRFFCVDPSFFEVFSFPFVAGDPKTALSSPRGLVLTRETARRYFGGGNAVGNDLEVVGSGLFKVTGVVENVPLQSHIRFDFLASYRVLESPENPFFDNWDNFVTSTYVLLKEPDGRGRFEANLRSLGERVQVAADGKKAFFFADRLTKIHLHATLDGELGPGGNPANLAVMTALAIFILLIACMNYMNLATARASRRAREVSVRKILGSSRRQLVQQFFGESSLSSLLGFALALVVVWLTTPKLNVLAQKELGLAAGPVWLFALMGAVVLLTGLIAGSYPALVLSRFQPVSVLRRSSPSSPRGRAFLRVLVVSQFVISVILIVCTMALVRQQGYLQKKELGFNKDQVVVLRMEDSELWKKAETAKNELLQNPKIISVTAASNVPGKGLGTYGYRLEGSSEWIPCATYFVDADYLDTLGIKILEGRGFDRNLPTDAGEAFIINASAAARFGWKDAVGKSMNWDGEKQGRVIGVVEDFHFQSLDQRIAPLVLHIQPEHDRYLAARVAAPDIAGTLSFIREKWEAIDPDHPFQYGFLDETFEALFRRVGRFGRVFGYAAVLAMIIACLGLFGLSAFAVDRRRKEVGIRKTLGASAPQIFRLLSKEFARLVLLAVLLAWPLAFLAKAKILKGFAYRADIGWWVYLLAGGLTTAVAVVTVGLQAVRAAVANPAESLRYQ